MNIDSAHFISILKANQLFSPQIDQFLKNYQDYQEKKFKYSDFSKFRFSDWKLDPQKAAITKNLPKDMLVRTALRHIDPTYPFVIVLSLVKGKSKTPTCVRIEVSNQYSANYNVQVDVDIITTFTSKQKTPYLQLADYWQSGDVLKQLTPQAIPDVSFAQAKKSLGNQVLFDVQDKKIASSEAQMIQYLYEKIKAKKVFTLDDEPIHWDIPSSLANHLSSGFVDALQEQMQTHTDNSQKNYLNFFKQYPTVAHFAKNFDKRYF